MRILVALILCCLATNVARAGIVVWMHEDLDSKYTERADNKTGGTEHTDAYDLLYRPAALSPEDEAAWEALRQAVSNGKKRWNDFEVELGIARELATAIEGITVVRGEADREKLIEALLFQGAAAHVAFTLDDFVNSDDAEPFRYARVGGAGVRPWADAIALDPTRDPLPSDLADGGTFPKLSSELADMRALEKGTLAFSPTAPNDEHYVDGRKVEGTEVEVAPGLHWVHVLRNGAVSGRATLRVEPGKTATHKPDVSPEDIAIARGRVLAGSTTGFPDAVRRGLERISKVNGGQLFVGAYDDGGKMVVLPYAHGATLLKQRRVTVVGVGNIGGGLIASSLFDQATNGDIRFAPMAGGDLGLELGLLNVVVLGGAELSMTPGNTITHGKRNAGTNVDTSIYVQPYGGLGVYILRPTGRKATMMLAANYQWLHPAHHAVGGRFALGLPIDDSGAAWFRVTVGGSGFPSSMWDEGATKTSMIQAFLRLGVARRF